MSQPIRKLRKPKLKADSIEGTGNYLDYCQDCPFLMMNINGEWACGPTDYVFGKIEGNIPVPEWCGNHKPEDK